MMGEWAGCCTSSRVIRTDRHLIEGAYTPSRPSGRGILRSTGTLPDCSLWLVMVRCGSSIYRRTPRWLECRAAPMGLRRSRPTSGTRSAANGSRFQQQRPLLLPLTTSRALSSRKGRKRHLQHLWVIRTSCWGCKRAAARRRFR